MNAAYKALADPTRRRILKALQKGEVQAGKLADEFDLSAPTMSHHFAVLKQADLIRVRREGTALFYSLNTTVFQDVVASLLDLLPGPQNELKEQQK